MFYNPATPQRPVVAIINTAEEIAEMLQYILDEDGFSTVIAYIADFKRGRQDFGAFLASHQPQAVVYDIALPYIENWTFFQEHILGAGFLPAECFVLTSTNKTVLEVLVGPTPTLELIGRPYDLDVILQAMRRAAKR